MDTLYQKIIEELAGHTSWHLDFGCGTGERTHFIARQLAPARTTGYDVVPDVIDIARDRYAAPSLSFEDRKSIEQVLLSPSKPTSATCNFVLHDTYDPLQQLKVIRNLTASEAHLYIMEHDLAGTSYEQFMRVALAVPDLMKEVESMGSWSAYTAHTHRNTVGYARMVREAGFEVLTVDAIGDVGLLHAKKLPTTP